MDTKNLLKIKKVPFIFVFVFIYFFIGHNSAQAATLRISPSTVNMSVGSTTTLSIFVNSEGVAVNNAEGVVNFPSDLFEVVSVSKAGSVFSLWIEEPSFSNSSGIITFNGGVPTPGFTGSAGKVLSFVVKAKKSGQDGFTFSSSAVRANDGLGTDILTTKSPSVLDVQASAPKEKEVLPKVENKPSVINTNNSLKEPVIISNTHPDSNAWYSLQTATFNWNIPSTATSIQTLFNKIPDSIPNITYDSSVSQKTLTGLADRVFYFHLRYKEGNTWSPVAHYKFKIDATIPEVFEPAVKTVGNNNVLVLNANDITSGIGHYLIKIDDMEAVTVNPESLVNNEYVLPVLAEGKHNLTVIAYDKAGNSREVKSVFTNSFSIEAPVITVSPSEIFIGQTATIEGKTNYPDTEVLVSLEFSNKEIATYNANTDENGAFSIVTEKIKTIGFVDISAVNIVSTSVTSKSSEKIQLKVNDKDVLKFTVKLDDLIRAGVVLGLLILLLAIGWIRYFRLRNGMRKLGGKHPIEDIYNAAVLLKEELNKQIKILEKIKADGTLNKIEEVALNEIQHKEQAILNDMQKK